MNRFGKLDRGFTLIELVITVAVSGLLGIVIVAAGAAFMNQARFDRAIVEANAIAAIADNAQNLVVSSTEIDAATGRRAYTYAANYTTWTAASVLKAAIGADMATTSPYGTNYEVVANGHPATVRFVVPADRAEVARFSATELGTVIDGSGNVTVTVMALRRPTGARITRARNYRAISMNEEIR